MKVVHLTVLRTLSGGQRKQLQQERIAARALSGIQWDTVAVHDHTSQSDFEHRTPLLFRQHFLRFLYGWYIAKKLSKQYDLLLMRHAPFDLPGSILSRLIRNRVSVHHSREVEELPLIRPGFLGKVLAVLERVAGGVTIRNTVSVLGVTREIAEYEVRRARCPDKPINIYPNTIVTRFVEPLQDERQHSKVQAAFMCGRFTAWHGLDILVDDARRLGGEFSGKLQIHLIGSLNDEQRKSLIDVHPGVFVVHGHLTEEQYRIVISRCDVGIGSLALSRQLMSEGSTLKMCEMLAMGLPVYSGNPDVVLPDAFRYCKVDPAPSISALYDFGLHMKESTRDAVRTAASPYIEKQTWMQTASDFLMNLSGGGRSESPMNC